MAREGSAREQRLKQAEETLGRRERHFRGLIEKGQDVIALMDSKGIMLYQSASVERILGYSPEYMVGKRALEFVHPDDQARVIQTMADALAIPEGSGIVEYRLRTHD